VCAVESFNAVEPVKDFRVYRNTLHYWLPVRQEPWLRPAVGTLDSVGDFVSLPQEMVGAKVQPFAS
jgi:hypothetical protein